MYDLQESRSAELKLGAVVSSGFLSNSDDPGILSTQDGGGRRAPATA
jgi:hypothetical protein